MFSSWNRLFKSRDGVAAVEFAVSLPIFVALLVGMTEVGRALIQANAIEKGLRAGAMYVARAQLPIDAATTTAVSNLVKRGSTNASAPYLIDGWAHAGAAVSITPLADYVTNGVSVPVFEVTASVPFTPILTGIPAFTMTRSHQQAFIGR